MHVNSRSFLVPACFAKIKIKPRPRSTLCKVATYRERSEKQQKMPLDRGLVKKGKEGIFLQAGTSVFSYFLLFRFFVSGAWIPPSVVNGIPEFLELNSGFQGPQFWIPPAKISQIPESGFLCMYDLLQTIAISLGGLNPNLWRP